MPVADQRATQTLLQAALEILKGFYGEKNTFGKVSLLRKRQSPPPMTGFKDYSNKQAGGVQGMAQTIIDDATTMENEAISAEENAQQCHDNAVQESAGPPGANGEWQASCDSGMKNFEIRQSSRNFFPAAGPPPREAEMKVQMKRAGEDRRTENTEFQMPIADQRATQKLLQAALARPWRVRSRGCPEGTRELC